MPIARLGRIADETGQSGRAVGNLETGFGDRLRKYRRSRAGLAAPNLPCALRRTRAIRRPRREARVEKRYVRLRWRSVSTTALGPVTKPPAAEPIAFPRVPVVIGMRSRTPCSSPVPRPVFPRTPVAWESSTASTTPCASQMRTSSGRSAGSPSIEKTPSVIISRWRETVSSRHLPKASCRCGAANRLALPTHPVDDRRVVSSSE